MTSLKEANLSRNPGRGGSTLTRNDCCARICFFCFFYDYIDFELFSKKSKVLTTLKVGVDSKGDDIDF
jgi:hypothetical protein